MIRVKVVFLTWCLKRVPRSSTNGITMVAVMMEKAVITAMATPMLPSTSLNMSFNGPKGLSSSPYNSMLGWMVAEEEKANGNPK